MSDESIRERAGSEASGIAATVVTGTWLVLLLLDFPTGVWLSVMLFGYIVVVPVISMLFDEDEEKEEKEWSQPERQSQPKRESDDETPLERLRRRYAEGELTDEQFERKLERLLETETLEDVEDRERLRETELE